MGDLVKAALILAAAILMATAAMIYFSPYQSCMRHGQWVETVCVGRSP